MGKASKTPDVVPARLAASAITIVTVTYTPGKTKNHYTAHVLKSVSNVKGLLYEGNSWAELVKEVDNLIDEDDTMDFNQKQEDE